MKKSINEAAKLKRLAGLITESEYQEEIMNTEAKSSVSKEDKIEVIKEWIWYTCDEGDAKDDINKYNKMVDMYFADKDDVTKEDFKKIWAKVIEKYGVGDVGADWEAFPETWKDVQNGTLVNPGQTYEGKDKEEEAFSDVNEYSRFGKLKYLSPAGFDRASGLVKTDSVRKMLEAAEDMMEDLTNEGFEVLEVREFFTQLIANDI
jgi:hypothetical protein